MINLTARTTRSINPQEAKRRVLNLYREWLREALHMIETHPLDLPVGKIRSLIRKEFEKHQHVTSPAVIDGLILRGTQELIEMHQKWKQKTHALQWFDEDERRQELENERLLMRVAAPVDAHRLPPASRNRDKEPITQGGSGTRPISPFLHQFLKAGGPF